jgi:hypothetical protein
MEQHFYRAPWTKERVAFLVQWWPRFGSAYIAEQLGLTVQQVKSKVNKLRLRLLPRAERLCVRCRVHTQYPQQRSLLCRGCYLEHRKESRRARAANLGSVLEAQKSAVLRQWIAEIVPAIRNRARLPAEVLTG